jgi:Protein of unknown function (DUF3306)
MSETEGFLRRWARLKRQAKASPDAMAPDERESMRPVEVPEPAGVAGEYHPPQDEPAPDMPGGEPGKPPAELDLPPLDTLGKSSDYTKFMDPRVPAEMQREALRRAWLTDPQIRNFREMADYDWDFNAPGYGALLPTDNVAELAGRIFSELEKTREKLPDGETPTDSVPTEAPAPAPPEGEPSTAPDLAAGGGDPAASDLPREGPGRVKHGGARPS